MELMSVIKKRRSVRKYSGKVLSEDQIQQIINAGLLSPSSRNFKSAEFIVVTGKESLTALGKAKAGGNMMEMASHAIVVIGDSEKSDAWIEDASIAMTQMMLAVADLGLGSCWIHIRNRMSTVDGVSSEDYVKELLQIPDNFRVLAILSIGVPMEQPKPHTIQEIDSAKIHIGKF